MSEVEYPAFLDVLERIARALEQYNEGAELERQRQAEFRATFTRIAEALATKAGVGL